MCRSIGVPPSVGPVRLSVGGRVGRDDLHPVPPTHRGEQDEGGRDEGSGTRVERSLRPGDFSNEVGWPDPGAGRRGRGPSGRLRSGNEGLLISDRTVEPGEGDIITCLYRNPGRRGGEGRSRAGRGRRGDDLRLESVA